MSASAPPRRRQPPRHRAATALLALAALLAGPSAVAQPVKAGAPSGGRDGRAVYDAVCAACHTTGVLKAPKLGDTAAWRPLA